MIKSFLSKKFSHPSPSPIGEEKTRLRNLSGFTLIELMVAIALGLIVIGGMGFIFSNAKVSSVFQQDFNRVQENGRFAIEMLARDVRQAGYYGCVSQQVLQNTTNTYRISLTSTTDPLVNTLLPLEGYENGGATTWYPLRSPAINTPSDMDTSSDAITIRFAHPDVQFPLTQDMVLRDDDPITVDSSGARFDELKEGSIMVISSCGDMTLFNLEADPVGGVLDVPPLSAAFTRPDGVVKPMVAVSYYVKTINSVATLMREELFFSGALNTQPLIPGIESLQIRYGVDTTGDGIVNSYYKANDAALQGVWPSVSSVEIAVLANSAAEHGQPLDSAPTAYQVLDESIDPDTLDKPNARRAVFSTTIALRQSKTGSAL